MSTPSLRGRQTAGMGFDLNSVVDARRGEVFTAGWVSPDGRRRSVIPPQVVAPDRLAEVLHGLGRPLAVGDGALKWRVTLEHAGASVPDEDSELHRVSAAAHCRLAREAPEAAPEEVLPDYLRLPDAEIARRAALPDGS